MSTSTSKHHLIRKFAVLTLTGLLLSAARCEDIGPGGLACTEIGCSDMLTMKITGAGNYETGKYLFTVSPEGFETITLECDIDAGEPFENCHSGGAGPLYLEANGNGEAITLVLEGPWGEIDSETVAVHVELDEESVVVETLSPEWSEIYPNGEECDDDPCYQADATLEISRD